jgi:hypothetical protein
MYDRSLVSKATEILKNVPITQSSMLQQMEGIFGELSSKADSAIEENQYRADATLSGHVFITEPEDFYL